ncbi:hypothetical protein [Stenotrophomonas maltophilia]|uniref:hypothetical protein n=1 Tax=Stenotrophomonas maltophilia TaxID=40324 RepID=UPI0009A150E0|nr:hypothetical protein [Stenotrophomonas maltophilia]
MTERGTRLYWLLVAVIWLLLMAALIHAGTQPDYWMQRALEPGVTLSYPTSTVATFALMATAELAVIALIAKLRWKRLWLRLLIAFALLLAWSVPFAMGAMHHSPVYGMHLLWLLLVDVALLVATIGVSLAAGWQTMKRSTEH